MLKYLLLFLLSSLMRSVIGFRKIQAFAEVRLRSYDIEIRLGRIRFVGLFAIQLDDVSVVSRRYRFTAEFLQVKISFHSSFKETISVRLFHLVNASILFFEGGEHRQAKTSVPPRSAMGAGIFEQILHTITRFFRIFPKDLRLENIQIHGICGDWTAEIELSVFDSKNHSHQTILRIGNCNNAENQLSTFIINGTFDYDEKKIRIDFQQNEHTRFDVSDEQSGTIVQFESMALSAELCWQNSEEVAFLSYFCADSLLLSGSFLADSVFVQRIESNLSGLITTDALIIEHQSSLCFNDLKFRINAYAGGNQRLLKLNLKLEETTFDEILGSFPFKRIDLLNAIRTSGKLSAALALSLSFVDRGHCSFSAKLNDENFFIDDNVSFDPAHFSGTFVRRMRPDNMAQSKSELNPEYRPFTTLDRISETLINTVVITEDPNFYLHKGFDEKFFSLAIATNLKERRFARGGSTITMQLMRNLYLDHSKTLNRKLEEIVMAWLIERDPRISKNRLLETYLNVIEFANNVYGIAEASDLYFSKPPSELSYLESLVLTYIIPRPKYFIAALKNSSPQLKRNLANHIKMYSRVLYERKLMSEDEYVNLPDEINFGIKINVLLKLL